MIGIQRLDTGNGGRILARQRFYQALLAGSAMMTAGVGIKSQTAYDDFEPLAYGPIQDQRVSAYSGLVGETAPLENLSYSNIRNDRAASLAQKWVDGMKRGELKPLPPMAYEDSFDVPAKSQILSSTSNLANYLTQAARKQLERGDAKAAMDNAILIVELSSIFKYSDFQSIGAMGMQQKKALQVIDAAIPNLTIEERRASKERLEKVWQDLNHEPLSSLLALRRGQYIEYWQRHGVEVPSSETKAEDAKYPEASAGYGFDDLKKSLRLTVSQSDDDDFMTFVSQIHFGYRTEAIVQEAFQDVLQKMG